jgi:tRNA A37 methylthiotransferase MiaB
MSQAVVEAVASHAKLSKCFHIPFQAGDDEILKAMGRGHTVEQVCVCVCVSLSPSLSRARALSLGEYVCI